MMVRDQTRHDAEDRKLAMFELVVPVVDEMTRRRDAYESVPSAMVLQELRRQRPDFSVGDHGFRSFGAMLDEAESRGLIELASDGEPGNYLVRSLSWNAVRP